MFLFSFINLGMVSLNRPLTNVTLSLTFGIFVLKVPFEYPFVPSQSSFNPSKLSNPYIFLSIKILKFDLWTHLSKPRILKKNHFLCLCFLTKVQQNIFLFLPYPRK